MLREGVGELGLTPMQYYGLTFYDYTLRMEGYRRRNTEQWRKVRVLYTLLYNSNVKGEQQKPEWEIMPLPGDESIEYIRQAREKETKQLVDLLLSIPEEK